MTAANIAALVRANGRRIGSADAIVEGHQRWTFADLDAEMVRVAQAVMATGIGPGDRVGIWGINSARWIAAMAGVLAAGATVVPVSSRFKGIEAAHVLQSSDVRLLFSNDEIHGVDVLAALHRADPRLRNFPIVSLKGRHECTTGWDEFIDTGARTPVEEVEHRLTTVTGDDVAYVVFTSGTTGTPKGAMVTHAAILRTATEIAARFSLGPEERIFVVLPFSHVFGLAMHAVAAATGGTCVLAASFDPQELARLVERHRITVIPGPPPIFQGLLDAPNRSRADLSSLRVAFMTSTGIPGALVRRLLHEGMFTHVTGGYGCTESICVSLSVLGEDIERAAEWSGQVLPDVDVRVVNPDGATLPPGEPGEFVVRTPTLMKGYLGDPAATAAAFTADGWLRTGDIGVLDEHGYLRVTDRKKDMFIVGGFNAYPAEIETILATYPGVRQVAVIGVPDDRLGEVGAAYIIPTPDAQLSPRDLINWARQNMANYKVPRYIQLVDELPLTSSLKVAKFVLRERFAASDRHAGAAAPRHSSPQHRAKDSRP